MRLSTTHGHSVLPAGATTHYACASPNVSDNIISLQWVINGTNLEELNLPNVPNSKSGLLYFYNVSVELNHT